MLWRVIILSLRTGRVHLGTICVVIMQGCMSMMSHTTGGQLQQKQDPLSLAHVEQCSCHSIIPTGGNKTTTATAPEMHRNTETIQPQPCELDLPA